MIPVIVYDKNQCDPKKCTAKRMLKFGLAKEAKTLRNIPSGSIVLSPFADKALSPADMKYLTLMLVGIGALVSMLTTGSWFLGMGIMIVVSLVFCFVSYYWSKEMALSAARARIVTEDESPRLYRIVKEVSEKAGLPMPEVGISPDPAPNAFATGRNPKNAAVVCTQGILSMLPDDELRGVIAHEMSHVKNRDILVMSITAALASIVSYMARMLMWMVIFTPSGGRDDNSRIALIAVAIAAQILVPIAAILVQLGISRNREYLADVGRR